MLIIRKATLEDLESIDALARVIWQEHYTPIIGTEQVEYMLKKFQSVNSMREQVANGYEYSLVNYDQQLIGYMSFRLDPNHLFLSKFYLKEQYRGKGFAHEMLAYIEKKALQNKRSSIQLTVNKYNTKSIHAYLKMGFDIEEDAVFDIGEGFVMDDHVMVKEIN